MEFHITPLGAIVLVVLWWVVLTALGLRLAARWSRDVTPEAPGMSRRALRREVATMRRWRRRASLLWRLAGHLSGGRRAWVESLSRRCTDRAQEIERRRHRRQAARVEASMQQLQAARAAATRGSSPCSPSSLPPSAPRPTLDPDEENTRRWERTLPWGTPSPLLTRQGRGKPYPFVPLSPPLPPAAPRSSRRARRVP